LRGEGRAVRAKSLSADIILNCREGAHGTPEEEHPLSGKLHVFVVNNESGRYGLY